MFWAYGNLSKLEIVCAESFVHKGYSLNLWSYGHINNAPSGVNVKDAKEILPESLVFTNKLGSYASFADIFRYAVLNKHGGLWADTDVAAILPANELPNERFLVTERVHGHLQINNNVIFDPSPQRGGLLELAYNYSISFPHSEVRWSELGPDLLTALASIDPNLQYKLMPPGFANPIASHLCPEFLLQSDFHLDTEPAFVHLFNERWRMTGTDKSQTYPDESVMSLLEGKRSLKVKHPMSLAPQERLYIQKARICEQATPPALIKRLAEFLSTLSRWSGVRFLQRLADWLWNIGLRITAFRG